MSIGDKPSSPPSPPTTERQKGSIRYRYALDGPKLIDIQQASRLPRDREYTCLSCGNQLVPVLQGARQKHFRHKAIADCSSETYLHNLAKQSFFENYTECLRARAPFYINYLVPKRCTACASHGPCEIDDEMKRVDLTAHFREIHVERRDGDFVPDILLKSSENKLYVEIAVTHFAEEEKQASGIRMIELAISDEADIGLIASCALSEEDPRVSLHNFRRQPIDGAYASECDKTVKCFILYPNGKSRLDVIPIPEFEHLSAKKPLYVEKVAAAGPAAYVNKAADLFMQGMKIRSCWLCTYHCLHYRTHENYCRHFKKNCEADKACDCKAFEGIKSIPEGGLYEATLARLTDRHGPHQLAVKSLPPPPAPRRITFFGASLTCCNCQTSLILFTAARETSGSSTLQEYQFISKASDGSPRYSRKDLDELLRSTIPDDSGTFAIGVLVRYQGLLLHIQCPECSEHYPLPGPQHCCKEVLSGLRKG